MKSKFINICMFAAGAAIGSAVTWKVMQTKCEQLIQTEVDAFKLSYAEAMTAVQEQTDESESEDEEEQDQDGRPHQINWDELEDLNEDDEDELAEYAELTNLYSSEKGGAEKVETAKPYVISPYDFGEEEGYRRFELTYYADGILEDEDYNVVTGVEDLIGKQSLTTFGEYEDDSVFVRNDKLRADFQILKDPRTYAEARGISPDRVSNE